VIGARSEPYRVDNANFAAASHRTNIRGLFLAGDTIFPRQGTLGVSMSGFNAARSAARFLQSRPQKEVLKEAMV
jgi:phytoene dehydrogenase-like protein